MITIANWIANLLILGFTVALWLIVAFLFMVLIAGAMHLIDKYKE
tara:strand:+ start:660 stop:794 length:135 start_codon:yes stop_codon:yes gene_type:complete